MLIWTACFIIGRLLWIVWGRWECCVILQWRDFVWSALKPIFVFVLAFLFIHIYGELQMYVHILVFSEIKKKANENWSLTHFQIIFRLQWGPNDWDLIENVAFFIFQPGNDFSSTLKLLFGSCWKTSVQVIMLLKQKKDAPNRHSDSHSNFPFTWTIYVSKG